MPVPLCSNFQNSSGELGWKMSLPWKTTSEPQSKSNRVACRRIGSISVNVFWWQTVQWISTIFSQYFATIPRITFWLWNLFASNDIRYLPKCWKNCSIVSNGLWAMSSYCLRCLNLYLNKGFAITLNRRHVLATSLNSIGVKCMNIERKQSSFSALLILSGDLWSGACNKDACIGVVGRWFRWKFSIQRTFNRLFVHCWRKDSLNFSRLIQSRNTMSISLELSNWM